MADIVSGGGSADAARAAARSGDWRASPLRVFFAIMVGAPLGGLLTTLFSALATMAGSGQGPRGNLVAAFFGLSLIWLGLIGLPGAIPWAILHRAGRRGWVSALSVGGLGFGLVGVGVTAWVVMSRASREGSGMASLVALTAAVIIGGACALIGAVVAVVMWRIAYRRGPSTDVSTVFT
jgi:hypothetical protein